MLDGIRDLKAEELADGILPNDKRIFADLRCTADSFRKQIAVRQLYASNDMANNTNTVFRSHRKQFFQCSSPEVSRMRSIPFIPSMLTVTIPFGVGLSLHQVPLVLEDLPRSLFAVFLLIGGHFPLKSGYIRVEPVKMSRFLN